MSIFNSFPLMNAYSVNLDWIMKKIRELEEYVRNYTAVNNVAYAGVWDITKQYPQWALVTDGEASYLALQPVPAGIPIDNADYWQKLADLDPRISGIIVQLSKINSIAVDTVSDIKSLDVDMGNMVFTSGFYTAGDGGGNAYVIRDNVTADNMAIFATAKPGLFAVSISDDNNIAKYGAKAADGEFDNGIVINRVLEIHSSAYIPKGLFSVKTPIKMVNERLFGAGKDSVLNWTGGSDALIYAGRSSVIEYLTLKQENRIDNSVGILCNYTWALQRTSIGNIEIINFDYGIKDDDAAVFSVRFHDIELTGCNFGIHFTTDWNTANVFENIYIHGSSFNNDVVMKCGFFHTGIYSNTEIVEMNIEHGIYTWGPVTIENCMCAKIEAIHLERCRLRGAYSGLVKLGGTNAKIGSISAVMCNSDAAGMCIMRLDKETKSRGGIDNSNYNYNVEIDNLVLWGIMTDDGGITPEKDFFIAESDGEAKYNLSIGSYSWHTYNNDKVYYKLPDRIQTWNNINVYKLPNGDIAVSDLPSENLYFGKIVKYNNVTMMWDGSKWLTLGVTTT